MSIFDRGIGTVQAYQSVLVRARVDGTIDDISFREGQSVKAVDQLALIDPRPYRAALDQVLAKRASDQAQLDNAKRDLARYANLAQRDFASRQSVDTQTAAVAQGQANVEGDDAAIATARLNLSFCTVTAPIGGRVGLRLVDKGNIVHASDQTGIVTIAQLQPISIVFTLPQESFPAVQGASAKATLEAVAYTGDDRTELSHGKLVTTDNTIDTTTGTIKLKAEFANTDERLWPGQFVNVHLLLRTDHAVTLPTPAVQHGPKGLFVYAVKPDSTVYVVPVETGQDDGRVTIITKGLAGGEQVVVAGQSRLTAGMRVTAASGDKVGG